MAIKDVSVLLPHGAWADGSSWARVITTLKAEAVEVFAAPLPLTYRRADRIGGHAAGAVIALARPERVKELVYVTALAPTRREGRGRLLSPQTPSPAPKLTPDNNGLIWLLEEAFATAFVEDCELLAVVQWPISLRLHTDMQHYWPQRSSRAPTPACNSHCGPSARYRPHRGRGLS
jgi:hypothetical protein